MNDSRLLSTLLEAKVSGGGIGENKMIECERCHRPMVIAHHAFWHVENPVLTYSCYYCNVRQIPGKPRRSIENMEGYLRLLADAQEVISEQGGQSNEALLDVLDGLTQIARTAPAVID